jgi:hypothetical protein
MDRTPGTPASTALLDPAHRRPARPAADRPLPGPASDEQPARRAPQPAPRAPQPDPAVALAAARGRVEDLEEAMRRIVVILEPDLRHRPSARDLAALTFACDALEVDPPVTGLPAD